MKLSKRIWAGLAVAFAISAGAIAGDTTQGLTLFGKMNQYSNDGYSAIWGYTDPTGREYALLGVRTGLSIIDITNPEMKEVAFIPGPRSSWREIKTYSHYAYVGVDSGGNGTQIIDLSDLPNSAKLVNTYAAYRNVHTLWTDEATKMLYLNGGSGNSVVALSLEDPVNPKEISKFGSTYVHDSYIKDGRAYLFEIMSKSWSVWDMKDQSKPTLIKRVRDSSAPMVSFHNGWPTSDGNHLVTTEETSGRTVKIYDIRDIQNPKLVSEYLPINKLAHNIQIKGRYGYLSSYGGGIRVLDLADPTKPTEVAFWHRDGGTGTGFQGVWGVYHGFKSGKVIGSDMEQGLVVVQFEGAKE